MLPQTLRITLCIAVVCYFIIIFYYLKRKTLELKYTLIWLFAGLVMGIMVFFPSLLTKFINLLGIYSNMNGLFILCIAFIILLLMMLTAIVSRATYRIRTLIQEMAILEKRLSDMEHQLNKQVENKEAED